ncbi:MAG TPA: GNAT family N-acetyltransferase [Anaerolineales bacterium]|nr:GNAT family N-acetyltransferase [Anaerolineales bacterium]
MPITYRQGSVEDSETAFQIFYQAISDLGRRTGVMAISGGSDPDVVRGLWTRRKSMFEHIARTASEFWIAENDGDPVGYARAIRRGGAQELTEFFVVPGEQSSGVGHELFRRAFPDAGATHRSIIATLDDRAQIRYLKAGLAGRFPIKYFSRQPELVEVDTDLVPERMNLTPEVMEGLRQIDRELIGHARPEDHRWLAGDRHGFIFRREGRIVGYGYVGETSGPFALMDADDFPAVLAHAENFARGKWDRFGIEVPLVNRLAIRHLIRRGYTMDSFTAIFMCDKEFGDFERYIFFGPPFMV